MDKAHICNFATVSTLHRLSYRPSVLISLLSVRGVIPFESMLICVKEVKRITVVHDC